MKPFRTFPVLQRLSADDFDLVYVEEIGAWTLQLERMVMFRLDGELVQATADFTKEEVALMMFDWMLRYHANGVSIGYDHGKETLRAELRSLLNVPATTKGD